MGLLYLYLSDGRPSNFFTEAFGVRVTLFLPLKVTAAMLCRNTFCLQHIHIIYEPIPFISTQPPQVLQRRSPGNRFLIRLVFVMWCRSPAVDRET